MAIANDLHAEKVALPSENLSSRDQVAQPFFLDQPGYREDHGRPRIRSTGPSKTEFRKIQAAVNAANFSIRVRANPTQQIPPIVLAHGDHSACALHFRSEKLWLCVSIDVPGVRGETVGYVDQFVSEHGDQCRSRGKVSVEVCDRAATQEICQVAGLKETPQDAKPAVAQSKEEGPDVAARQVSSDPQVRTQDGPAAASE